MIGIYGIIADEMSLEKRERINAFYKMLDNIDNEDSKNLKWNIWKGNED